MASSKREFYVVRTLAYPPYNEDYSFREQVAYVRNNWPFSITRDLNDAKEFKTRQEAECFLTVNYKKLGVGKWADGEVRVEKYSVVTEVNRLE